MNVKKNLRQIGIFKKSTRLSVTDIRIERGGWKELITGEMDRFQYLFHGHKLYAHLHIIHIYLDVAMQ